jgi:tRNA-specific 2-thiouridylase
MRVTVGLSGGVDSAVAAGLLKEQGYEVIGVHFSFSKQGSGCCGNAGYERAKRVAANLKIPFYVVNLHLEFEKMVIDNFCAEYARGRTPNPCIRCNQFIKFDFLRERAKVVEANFIATGHYARIVRDATGRFHLYRGIDPGKDQSYFLYTLNQEQLATLLLPLGDLRKVYVRQKARDWGLPNAEQTESQEVCFIPDNDYVQFLRSRHPELFRPGPVYDTAGRRLGTHSGIVNFTIGQRKGLGLALGERRYVVKIVPEENAIYLGRENEVYHTRVWAEAVHLIEPVSEQRLRVWAKVRYQSDGGQALVEFLSKERVFVQFETPQWAPTPGQAIVFYDGDCVLGGGIIERSET